MQTQTMMVTIHLADQLGLFGDKTSESSQRWLWNLNIKLTEWVEDLQVYPYFVLRSQCYVTAVSRLESRFLAVNFRARESKKPWTLSFQDSDR